VNSAPCNFRTPFVAFKSSSSHSANLLHNQVRRLAASRLAMAMLVFAGLVCCSAVAQTAHFSGVQRTPANGFAWPAGVAVDSSGNVYVADTGHNAVKEMLAVDGVIPASPTIVTLGSGFSVPNGVAVDGNGNVYVADTGDWRSKRYWRSAACSRPRPPSTSWAADFPLRRPWPWTPAGTSSSPIPATMP